MEFIGVHGRHEMAKGQGKPLFVVIVMEGGVMLEKVEMVEIINKFTIHQ